MLPATPALDWLMYQDGRGSANVASHVRRYFSEVRDAAVANGVAFWSDVELFVDLAPGLPEGNATRGYAGAVRVAAQLREEAPLVDGFVAWEFHWYLSPQGSVGACRDAADPACAAHSVPSNGSLHQYNDYTRVVLGDASLPPLSLRSAGAAAAASLPPAAGWRDRGQLTDGAAWDVPGDMLEWPAAAVAAAGGLNVTLDLRVPAAVADARVFVARDDARNVTLPSRVAVRTSADGARWAAAGDMRLVSDNAGAVCTYDLLLRAPEPPWARYVQFVFHAAAPVGAAARLRLAELEVYE